MRTLTYRITLTLEKTIHVPDEGDVADVQFYLDHIGPQVRLQDPSYTVIEVINETSIIEK